MPGPLESRRRLGKRQIGDLNTVHSTPSLPIWALSNAPDLTKWQWEAPNLPSDREERQRRQQEQLSFSGWPSISWPVGVRQWVKDKLAPNIALDMPESVTPAAAPITRRAQHGVEAAVHSISAAFQNDVEDFCALLTNASMETITSEFDHLSSKFQQYLHLNHLSKDDIYLLSARLWDALDGRFAGCSTGDSLFISLYSSILAGIRTCRVPERSAIDADFRLTLLLRMSSLPVQEASYDLFEGVMDSIPSTDIDLVSDGILAVLGNMVRSWPSSGSGKELARPREWLTTAEAGSIELQSLLHVIDESLQLPGNLGHAKEHLNQAKILHKRMYNILHSVEDTTPIDPRIRKISRALQSASPETHTRIFDAATRLVEDLGILHTESHQRLSYNWLSILAQMPLVNQDHLFDTAAKLLTDTDLALSDSLDTRQVCSLALSQWESRGYLKFADEVRHEYERICQGNPSTALASLMCAIFSTQPNEYRGVFVSFCRFLTRLNRLSDLGPSFQALGATQLVRVSLLQEIARAADNHRTAMDLHDLYKYHLHLKGGPEWDPAVYRGYIKRIVADPSIRPSRIWELLDIDMYEEGPGFRKSFKIPPADKSRHRGVWGTRRISFVEGMIVQLSEETRLSNRVAFRHVSQGVRFLEAHKGTLPTPVVKAVYNVVARDLINGQPGRTTRLRWFLRLVHKHVGEDEALQCSLLFKRWRMMVRTKWLANGGHGRDP